MNLSLSMEFLVVLAIDIMQEGPQSYSRKARAKRGQAGHPGSIVSNSNYSFTHAPLSRIRQISSNSMQLSWLMSFVAICI